MTEASYFAIIEDAENRGKNISGAWEITEVLE